MARGQGKDPAGVAGKGVWGRLKLMTPKNGQHPSLMAAVGHPGADLLPRSLYPPWSGSTIGELLSTRHPGMSSQVGLGSITTNKASGGDGIPVELLQILKDDAVKVLHLLC